MEERNITVTLEKAKEWYNSDNATLKEVALQAFSEEELKAFDFRKIKSFKDALLCLYPYNSIEYKDIFQESICLESISKASAAMFKLNIIRRALNKGCDMHLTKNVDGQNGTWYPYFRFIIKDCTYYNSELRNGTFKKIGKITSEGATYDVLGGDTCKGGYAGLGYFNSRLSVGAADASFGFLGCATRDIVEHFGLHFGMLVMEAMYGDMVDFNIDK